MARRKSKMKTYLMIGAGAAVGSLVLASKVKATVKKESRQTIADARKEGEKLAKSASDELLMVAGQLDANLSDLASASRIVREFGEWIGLGSPEVRLAREAEAAKRFNQIRTIFQEFNDKGHLTSARLHELGQIIAWQEARVRSGYTGKTVVPAQAIGFSKMIMEEAEKKKAVVYTSDVKAASIIAEGRRGGITNASLLYDEDDYDGRKALINMLDRNDWADTQDTAKRKMWYQVLSPKTASLARGFLSDVKAGKIKIYDDLSWFKKTITWRKFEEDYLPPE